MELTGLDSPNFSPEIILVSGWRGVGKTTLCLRLIEAARSAAWDVAGLASPARVEGSEKTGILVDELRTGQRRLLASRLEGELHGARLGPWTFDDSIFEWGNQALRSSIPCNMLVIDELGPLEFDRSQGWYAGFQVLDSKSYDLAVVVIRPEYVSNFLQRWPATREIVVSGPGEVECLTARLTAVFSEIATEGD
jgi:nucleoside-triphosphatase